MLPPLKITEQETNFESSNQRSNKTENTKPSEAWIVSAWTHKSVSDDRREMINPNSSSDLHQKPKKHSKMRE